MATMLFIRQAGRQAGKEDPGPSKCYRFKEQTRSGAKLMSLKGISREAPACDIFVPQFSGETSCFG